jgi:glycosyltransferase involved in cell wall biosynthesis
MKTALVHDWLVTFGGAERALEQMLHVLPEAELFAVCDFLSSDNRARLGNRPIRTSFIQRCPFARSRYREYLPLMPLAIEQLDVSGYDLVLSSSTAVAKGVITGPDQVHIAYVNSPMRYAWDLTHQYLRSSGLGHGVRNALARTLLHYLRLWDCRTAMGVDRFIANSHYIARRIRKVYRREAVVVYPPVAVNSYELHEQKEDFYVTVCRAVSYKRLDLMCEAFAQMPERKLFVIGDGPQLKSLRRMAGPNVTLLGQQPFEVVKSYLESARAFVFAAEEDFGIAPVEAQACGTPVVAFGKGGVSETVIDGKTGVLYHEQTAEALVRAIREFEHLEATLEAAVIRDHALSFSTERFRAELSTIIDETVRLQRQEPGRSSTAVCSFGGDMVPLCADGGNNLPRSVRHS